MFGLKKIAVFFRPGVRLVIEQEPKSPAVVSCMLALSEVLSAMTVSVFPENYRGHFRHKTMMDLLTFGSTEHDWLTKAAKKSSRLQVIVSCGPEKSLYQDWRFFQARRADPILELHLVIYNNGQTVFGSSSVLTSVV